MEEKLLQINHEHICRFYGINFTAASAVSIQVYSEYVTTSILKRDLNNVITIQKYVRELLLALEHLHNKHDIAHGDIALYNLFLDADDNIKLYGTSLSKKINEFADAHELNSTNDFESYKVYIDIYIYIYE